MVNEKYFFVIFIYNNYLVFNVFMIIRVVVNVHIFTVQVEGQIPLSRNTISTVYRLLL